MLKNIIVSFLTILVLYSNGIIYGVFIEEQLQKIPKKDQEILEDFFSNMISFEYFGYVLFGEKPMAAAGFDAIFAPEESLGEAAIKQSRIRLGWQTWEKYAWLFPSENFVLRLSKNSHLPSFHWIVIINKEMTLKCVKNNLNVFKLVLGKSATPELALDALIAKEDIFNDVLNKHDGLLGLLLGYGKNNSMKFQREHKTIKKKLLFEDNITSKKNKLTAFNKQSRNLFAVDLPRFAADVDHSESKALHESYEKTRKYLTSICEQKKYLKITLDKLTSN